MSSYTFLRVEVDSSVVERVLGLTPGVEVVDEFDTENKRRAPDERERTTDHQAEDSSDDDGLVSRATPDGDLPEEGSAVREYGLLGLGVSFVMLRFATVGIWWYRRRSSGSKETEIDSEFERPTETRTTETTAVEHDPPSPGTVDDTDHGEESDTTEKTDDESLSTVSPAADREDVEWTTKWDQNPSEPDEESDSEDMDAEEPSPRASESVDVAPLLGVAFIAISGAIVRWLQGGDQ
jgi:hypothetical protein